MEWARSEAFIDLNKQAVNKKEWILAAFVYHTKRLLGIDAQIGDGTDIM